VSGNTIPQILQKEVVSALGRGPSSLSLATIHIDALPREIIDKDVQTRFNSAKQTEITKTSFTGFVHCVVDPFLTDGMKGIISGTSAESELIPILMDLRALMDSELTGFLKESCVAINGAASEFVKMLWKHEKTHG
jgi:hypothetical protein